MNNGWPAAHDWSSTNNWQQSGGGTDPSNSSGLPPLPTPPFDGKYDDASRLLPPQGNGPPSQAYSSAFVGDQQPRPGQQGDLNAMYDMLNQGGLDQAQMDMMMGSAMGQHGPSSRVSVPGAGYGPQQMGGAGGQHMGPPSGQFAPSAPLPAMGYSPSNGLANSSAQPSPQFFYGGAHPSQPIHLNTSPYSQMAYSRYPPQQQPPPPPPHQRYPSQPTHPPPPPSTFPSYPNPGLAIHPIPPSLLAAHCANLDRITAMQNHIAERETFLNSHARGRDPATMMELQRQIQGLKAQQAPLVSQCQSFILANGGHEHVAAEVHAFRTSRQNGQAGPPRSLVQRPPQPLGVPTASLPFSLPQSAHARAFNNLPSAPPLPTPPNPTHALPVALPPQPLPPQPAPTPPTIPRTPQPPTPQQQQPSQRPQSQQQQQPARPATVRSSSGNLPSGLRAQMEAARRVKASQPTETSTPPPAITPLRRDAPIVPLVTKAGKDGALSARQVAPLPKSKEPRSATAILADSAPGMPTLAQLQGQLTVEKFNSILPVVLGKQNIRLAPPYSIGAGKHTVDLYTLYQAVMINGHGGEKVTADGRWGAMCHQINVPCSDGGGLASELADLYNRILMPFETVWSNALLAQRNSVAAQGKSNIGKGAAAPSFANRPPPSAISPPFTTISAGGVLNLAPPPPFNPSAYPYQSQASDVSIAAAAEQHQRERIAADAEVKQRGPIKVPEAFTPPASAPTDQSWLSTAAASVPRTASSGSRRSAGGGSRFEELGDGEADGRDNPTRKRSKSGDQSMMNSDEGGAFATTYPSSSAFVDPTQPMPASPSQFAQQTSPQHSTDLFSQFLYTGAPPPSLSTTSVDADPPSSTLNLDSTSLDNLGMDPWSNGAGQDGGLGDLSKWDGSLGLDGGFDFDSELSRWTSQ